MGILASFQAVLTMSGIARSCFRSCYGGGCQRACLCERTKEGFVPARTFATPSPTDLQQRAFSAIFDSNLASIITRVFILLLFGTGPIIGLCYHTLIIGLVCSFFTAVYLAVCSSFAKFSKTDAFNKTYILDRPVAQDVVSIPASTIGSQRKVSFAGSRRSNRNRNRNRLYNGRGLNQGIDFSGGRGYIVKFSGAL